MWLDRKRPACLRPAGELRCWRGPAPLGLLQLPWPELRGEAPRVAESRSEPWPWPGPCWVGRAYLSGPALGQVVLDQRVAVCLLRQGPQRRSRCQRRTNHPRFEGGPTTQKTERLPLLELYQAALGCERPRTARGGVHDPCRRPLLPARGWHLRLLGLGTCQHPPTGRLEEPLHAEWGPEDQGGERPRPGHRPSLCRPMPARLSRETGGGRGGHNSRHCGRGCAAQSATGVGGFASRGDRSGVRGCHDGEAKSEVDEIPRVEGG